VVTRKPKGCYERGGITRVTKLYRKTETVTLRTRWTEKNGGKFKGALEPVHEMAQMWWLREGNWALCCSQPT